MERRRQLFCENFCWRGVLPPPRKKAVKEGRREKVFSQAEGQFPFGIIHKLHPYWLEGGACVDSRQFRKCGQGGSQILKPRGRHLWMVYFALSASEKDSRGRGCGPIKLSGPPISNFFFCNQSMIFALQLQDSRADGRPRSKGVERLKKHHRASAQV